MQTITFLNQTCVVLENKYLSLLVSKSVGPRILSLQIHGSENIFAELPNFVVEHPGKETYHFYGGHRLWHAPENNPRTYIPDNREVEMLLQKDQLKVTQPLEAETGIQKSMEIFLAPDTARVTIQHTLTNQSLWPIECAPWTVTQLKPGGVAILPQSKEDTKLLPNRTIAVWPYTDVQNSNIQWGNDCILVSTPFNEGAFKIGFPNPRGWMAYWINNILFVKYADFDSKAKYYDFDSSSECYCNDKVLELETLAPITVLEPQTSVSHTETWRVFSGVERPENEKAVREMINKLKLE